MRQATVILGETLIYVPAHRPSSYARLMLMPVNL